MPSIPQILAMLETELSKHLVVSYTLQEHLSPQRSKMLLPDDTFVFVTRLRNNSSIAIKDVCGSIAPTRFTDFRIRNFGLRELQPGQESELAVVQARVTCNFRHGSVMNDIGRVTLTAAADLSNVQLQELGRPLIQIRPAAQEISARPRSRVVRRRVRGIPRSPTAAFDLHLRCS